jgi:chromosome segregation ATPase
MFYSPKSIKSSSDKFRTFPTESSDESENEEVRSAFTSLTIDFQQIFNELNHLKSENLSLKDQLRQVTQEKNSLASQYQQSKEHMEKQINDLKFSLDREEQQRKRLAQDAQLQKAELENRVNQILNEKSASENGLKKAMEKNRSSFKKMIEEKEYKIKKLLGALNSVKKIETQVKSMLNSKDSHAAQSEGNLSRPFDYRHMKSRSYVPFE